jgi:hypothetical protein
MKLSITITEVIGRSEQGATRPFLCYADDWMAYYVKGAYAGKNSLCCEWVASRLARLLVEEESLSLPPFHMAEVPTELIDASARADIRDLGAGKAFASLLIVGGQELTWTGAQGWPEETMAMILLMDLWLQNEDRSLSAHGGNPNLLVERLPPALWSEQPRREMLWVYDFNLAFDEDFDRRRLFGAHVFGGMLKQWPQGFRERMEPRMRQALTQLTNIFGELPLEWLHVDGDDSLPVQLDIARVTSVLELPFTDPENFWKLS